MFSHQEFRIPGRFPGSPAFDKFLDFVNNIKDPIATKVFKRLALI